MITAILALQTAVFPVIAQADGTPLMFVHGYEHEGERLSLVTLILRESDREYIPAFPDLSQYSSYTAALLNHVNQFVPETYISLGLIQRGSDMHRTLLEEGRTVDGRSVIVFATAENNLADIRAFVRFAHRGSEGDNGRLPVELHTPGIDMGDAEAVAMEVGGRPVIAAGVAEMKNAIQSVRTRHGYMGMLFAHAIRTGALGTSTQRVLVNGELRHVMPRAFTGEAHADIITTYVNEWGFESLDEISDPTQQFARFVSMPISTALTLDQRLGSPRPGRRPPLPVDPAFYRNVRWRPVRGLAKALVCGTALGGDKVSFYEELK